MPIEKSAGAIIFRREGNEIKYLLLHYPSATTRAKRRGGDEAPASATTRAKRRGGDEAPASATKSAKDYWDLPKGHIEKGEKEIETAKREAEEETGLKDLKFIEGFKEWIKYFFKLKRKNILKFVTFYLVETKTKEVKVSFEHLGYKWLPYEKALEKLTFKNAKEVLKKADTFLIEHYKTPFH